MKILPAQAPAFHRRPEGCPNPHESLKPPFFFRSYTSRYEIEAFPPSGTSTLHVRDSDLPAGRHENVGRWHEVIVGAPLWQTL